MHKRKTTRQEIRHTDSSFHLRAWVITLMCVQSRLFGQQVSSSLWHLSVCVLITTILCSGSIIYAFLLVSLLHTQYSQCTQLHTHTKKKGMRETEKRRDLMSRLPPDIASAMLINPAGKIHHQDTNP